MVLTQAGVFPEVPQELLALFLLVPAVPAATPRRDGEVRVISVLVVRRHVRPFEKNRENTDLNKMFEKYSIMSVRQCLPVSLSVYLSHCLIVSLSVLPHCLSTCITVSLSLYRSHLTVCLSVLLGVRLAKGRSYCVCITVLLSLYRSHFTVCLSVSLGVCLTVFLSVSLSVCHTVSV